VFISHFTEEKQEYSAGQKYRINIYRINTYRKNKGKIKKKVEKYDVNQSIYIRVATVKETNVSSLSS
jgi:hypothetical protein